MTAPSGARGDWYPLQLSTPARPLVFGGRAIAGRLGRGGLPDWAIGETWEVSDVDGQQGRVTNGPLAGRTLRDVLTTSPQEVMGRGWSGQRFPILTKFIDAAGALPVHLHADDATARAREGQENGKTEAWHVLDAAPGATALVGVQDGVSAGDLHAALLDQDFDRVLRRLPVRAGDTIHVPGGTVHSFGPDTLIYEIEQTSDVQQHAMCWEMADGSAVAPQQWRANLDELVAQVRLDSRPQPVPGLRVPLGDGADRVVLCASPYYALERWRVAAGTPSTRRFATAQILSNVGAPVRVRAGGVQEELGRARSLLLPAALGEVELTGPADVLVGYLPDLARDVVEPLRAAGYGAGPIAALGEGLPTGE